MSSQKGKAAKIKPEEFQFACLYLADGQRYIAAGKVQRWEVMKWAVSVNLALAIASSLATTSKWLLFGFCVLVASASIFLLHHYNNRVTKVREATNEIMKRLSEEYPDIEKFTGMGRYPTNPDEFKNYDKEEMTLFSFIIGLSVAPAFFVWALSWQLMR